MNAVFNPAAVQVNGETVLLARVEARTGISHLTVAPIRERRARTRHVERQLLLLALVAGDDEELWGFEDARAVWYLNSTHT